MQILKAYADAGATGRQGFNNPAIKAPKNEKGRETASRQQPSGDRTSISAEARSLLENGAPDLIAAGPMDATYDQYGNVLRQFDDLQNDLRRLASQLHNYPGAGDIGGQVNALRSQLTSLRTQV